MAAGIGNPVGYVPVMDANGPGIITGKAAGDISGGALVLASGAADNVSSGLNSFVTNDVAFLTDASGLEFAGVATHSAASGATVAVATKGVMILNAYNTVTASRTVVCEGTNSVANGTTAGHVMGRALSSATSGGYALVDVGRS